MRATTLMVVVKAVPARDRNIADLDLGKTLRDHGCATDVATLVPSLGYTEETNPCTACFDERASSAKGKGGGVPATLTASSPCTAFGKPYNIAVSG